MSLIGIKFCSSFRYKFVYLDWLKHCLEEGSSYSVGGGDLFHVG